MGGVPFRTLPAHNSATCVRATGPEGGLAALGPVGSRSTPLDLLAAGAEGPAVRARVPFGLARECPAVAEQGGAAVVAAPVVPPAAARRRSASPCAIRAAASGRSRRSAAWAALTTPRSPRVATRWSYGSKHGATTRARGAHRCRTSCSGRALRPGRGADSVGISQPVHHAPGRGRTRSRREGDGRLGAQPRRHQERPAVGRSRRRAGRPPFGPAQVLTPRTRELARLTLVAAAGGAALLAHDGDGVVRLFERTPGASGFGPARQLGDAGASAARTREPALALRDDGAAVVAWRGASGADAVRALTRPVGGGFGAERVVAPGARDGTFGTGLSAFFVPGLDRAMAPLDQAGLALRAVISATGRVALVWTARRPLVDAPLAPVVATGSLDGGFGTPSVLGSPARSVAGVAALLLPGGEPAVAWVDNNAHTLGFGAGRSSCSRATAGCTWHAPTPPRAPRLPRPRRACAHRAGSGSSAMGPCGRASAARRRVTSGSSSRAAARSVPAAARACPPAGGPRSAWPRAAPASCSRGAARARSS